MQITLASMGFDEENLLPTYKLLLNVVGRSYALEISYRLGLNNKIIENAKKYKSESSNNLDMLIDELSKKLKEENLLVEQIKEKEAKLQLRLEEITKEKEKLQHDYDLALKEVNNKKEEMIEEAYLQIQQIVDDFKNANNKEGYKHHLKNNAVEALENLSNKEESVENNDKIINVGDDVKLTSIGKIAKVKDIKGNKATIVSNNTTMIVSLKELEKISVNKTKQQKRQVKIQTLDAMQKNVPMSLNLIGMRVDEALIALRNYIDAALLVRYQQVNVIHGFGTGALRKAVHEYLKNCKYVVEYRLGGFNEGGAGATIVVLKGKK